MKPHNNRLALVGMSAALLVSAGLQAHPLHNSRGNNASRAFLPDQVWTVSTVPENGDVNPYGVAFVPQGFPTGGGLNPDDILVSNFNNNKNQQGTGSTIVKIAPDGSESQFFQAATSSPVGLTTALGVLKAGFVIVGSTPTTNGTSATAQAGALFVLDKNANMVATITDPSLINGPWDMAVNDQGQSAQIFVSNALSGTVTRFDLTFNASGITSEHGHTIASGYIHRGDPNALLIGPTGLVYNSKTDSLYIASTGDNAVFRVSNAGTASSDQGKGTIVYQDNQHLRGPLGLALAPNNDFLVTNGDAINPDPTQTSALVEFTPNGKFVKQIFLDPNPGAAFGLAVQTIDGNAKLAAVNDSTNALFIWTIPQRGK